MKDRLRPPYRPISCSVYDLLEASAVRHKVLELTIEGTRDRFQIVDVFAKGNEEFVVVSRVADRERKTIRIDTIEMIVDLSDNKSYLPYQT